MQIYIFVRHLQNVRTWNCEKRHRNVILRSFYLWWPFCWTKAEIFFPGTQIWGGNWTSKNCASNSRKVSGLFYSSKLLGRLLFLAKKLPCENFLLIKIYFFWISPQFYSLKRISLKTCRFENYLLVKQNRLNHCEVAPQKQQKLLEFWAFSIFCGKHLHVNFFNFHSKYCSRIVEQEIWFSDKILLTFSDNPIHWCLLVAVHEEHRVCIMKLSLII